MKRNLCCGVLWMVIAVVVICPMVANGAIFTVTSTADAGGGTLRWAITSANANPGADTIDFNIPGPGPFTIAPMSPLDTITDPVYIDGYTQTGTQPNTQPQGVSTDAILLIELAGTNIPGADALHIHSNDVIIRGLIINRFWNGICICSGSQFCRVLGCYIGTDPTGTYEHGTSTRTGVSIQYGCPYNDVGGVSLADRNVISGWDFGQVDVVGLNSDYNVIFGNYIGTEKDGLAAIGNVGTTGNGVSIYEDPAGSPTFNTVGGPGDTLRNVISGNPWEGIEIAGPGQLFNTVENNYIGVNVLVAPLGNGLDGIILMDCTKKNIIGPDNVIAYNVEDGIEVIHGFCEPADDTDFNTFHRNSIYDNGQLGIDLGGDEVTMNDPGDTDTGQNQQLNFPVIIGALYDPATTQTLVSGTIDIDTDPITAEVEIFQADLDPTLYGEGMIYLGSGFPDASGSWTAVVTGVSPEDSLTATTTDSAWNTSEFAECLRIPQPGCIAGVVADTSGTVLEGALVQAILNSTVMGEDSTDAMGSYYIEPLPPGNYDAAASKQGYYPDTMTGIPVIEGCALVDTFKLVPLSGVGQFIRGDVDGSGALTLGDGIRCFRCQFVPGWPDSCKCDDAMDADDGGTISIGDCLRILRKQFVPGWQDSIPPPCCSAPGDCGPDPNPDGLGCEEHIPCGTPIR